MDETNISKQSLASAGAHGGSQAELNKAPIPLRESDPTFATLLTGLGVPYVSTALHLNLRADLHIVLMNWLWRLCTRRRRRMRRRRHDKVPALCRTARIRSLISKHLYMVHVIHMWFMECVHEGYEPMIQCPVTFSTIRTGMFSICLINHVSQTWQGKSCWILPVAARNQDSRVSRPWGSKPYRSHPYLQVEEIQWQEGLTQCDFLSTH